MDKKDYYKLLELSKECTYDEIKLAYRKKAKDIHPDKNQNIDTTEEFQKLNEAYEVLINPELKKDYDYGNDYKVEFSFSCDADCSNQEINIETLTCDCEEWKSKRYKYPINDFRRLCKHLVASFSVSAICRNGYIKTLNIPKELKPFEEFIISYRKKGYGVKLFDEIVFLKSSIVVIDRYETGMHIYLHLKEHSNRFCSYKVFQAHKYSGIGFKWMLYSGMREDNSYNSSQKDNIDGKDYIHKRFNVLNNNMQLCGYEYDELLYIKKEKEKAESDGYLYIDDYYIKFPYIISVENNDLNKTIKRYEHYVKLLEEKLSNYDTTPNILEEIKSNYSTRSFHSKLKSMGYIKKEKHINKNQWILTGDGLKYGMNYITHKSLCHIIVPDWYILTYFEYETLSFKREVRARMIKLTSIMWDKHKFNKLLNIMDTDIEPPTPKIERKKRKQRTEGREWLEYVICHNCGSKNIYKKGVRQSTAYKVQRYQCQDCKKIFQEEIKENLTKQLEKQNSESLEYKFNFPKHIFELLKKVKDIFR